MNIRSSLFALAGFLVSLGNAPAQQTFTYIDGQNISTGIVITPSTNPTMLVIDSGTATQSGDISESGTAGVVEIVANRKIIFSGTNSYSGGTIVGDGTLQVSADDNLGASTGSITLTSGELLTDGTTGFITGRTFTINGNGTIAAATNTTATYTGTFSGGPVTIGDGVNTGTINLASTAIATGSNDDNVDGGQGGLAMTLNTSASLVSGGTVTGGNGGNGISGLNGGNGGDGGSAMTLGTNAGLTNNGTIKGGTGGIGGVGGSGFIGGTGGSGGDGGIAVTLDTGASLTNNGAFTGGTGGSGGDSNEDGGIGGSGEVAVTMEAGTLLTNNGTITGGSGGTGGNSIVYNGVLGGAGANGAVAVELVYGSSLSNTGTITGGNGGNGGAGLFDGGNGGVGAGAMILDSDTSMTNNGMIAGGNGGNGGAGNYGFGDSGGYGSQGGTAATLGAGASLTNNDVLVGGSGGSGGLGTYYGGNAGSGGAAATLGAGALLINNVNGVITGGNGGNGGSANSANTDVGGGGGKGAVAVNLGTNANLINGGTITGGNGGSGGSGGSIFYGGGPGAAGSGGVAVVMDSGAGIFNSGTITGGSGNGQFGYPSGAGGAAITASGNDAVINAGSITAGQGYLGEVPKEADAIDFSGGGNVLELYSTSQITGNVVSSGGVNGGDALWLGGTDNGTFDVPLVGASGIDSTAQYQGFTTFVKADSGTWTLTNTTTAVTPWTIAQGMLSVSSDGALGDDSGTLTMSGATLQTTASFSSSRRVVLIDNVSTIDTDGNSLTLGGTISGSGSLTLNDSTGTGTLTLSGSNTFTGGVAVDAGTLAVYADNNLGAATSTVTLSGTEFLTLASPSGFSSGRTYVINGSGTIAAVTGSTATYTGSFSGGLVTLGDATNTGTIVFGSTFTSAGANGFEGYGGTDGNSAIIVNTGVSLINGGTINGGNGGGGYDGFTLQTLGSGHPSGGNGGDGAVAMTVDAGAGLVNTGTITGGSGGNGGSSATGGFPGNGGNGATGVALGANSTLANYGTITGGSGGTGGASYGSGGNGAAAVTMAAGASLTNNGTLAGGNAGASGPGAVNENEGSAGLGVSMDSNASLINNGAIAGGSGAGTGFGNSSPGSGVGMNTGDTLTNHGTISGGGGNSGLAGFLSAGGAVTGAGHDTVINSGTITNATGGNAVYFAGGGNTLELHAASQITGYVYSDSGTTNGGDTLKLGGATNGTFDASQIGVQYQGFSNYAKTGTGTWTLTGIVPAVGGGTITLNNGTIGGGSILGGSGTTQPPTVNTETIVIPGAVSVTPWTISQGVLSVSADGSLGAESSTLTLDGGTLQTTASFSSTRSVAITSNGGGIDTYGTSLALGGTVTGPGGLTYNDSKGTGTLTLTAANTYAGGTNVRAGTLLLDNGTNGSATGSGALTVAAGAAIGGAGTSNSTAFTINGTVIAGNGSDATSQLTLTATGASTISGANLVFNLGTGAQQGQSNLLNLGATPVTFSDTTLQFNLLGGAVISPDTAYTLITFSSPINAAADGLTLGANGQIIGGLTIANLGDFGASLNGYNTGFYDGSYLFINGDSIDVEVVPEPSTWAMLALALAFLAAYRCTRRKPASSLSR